MVFNYASTLCKCTSPSKQTDRENDSEKPPAPPSNGEDPVEDYNPHSHGKQQHPTIFWGSIFHLFKYTVGITVLSLPYAFKEVGYSVAIFGVILVGCIYAHVMHNLLQVEYELCKKLKKPNLTYAGVVQHSFEQGPRYFQKLAPVATSLIYFHYVFNKSISNAAYLITIGGNFKIIIEHFYNIDTNFISIITPFMIVLISLALIRNLKFLVPLSILTICFNIINFIIIVTIPIEYNGLADFKAVADISKFPFTFSLVLAALNCTAVVMPLKNDMKEPKKFTAVFGVLNIALSAAGTMYLTFGTLGYVKYGDSVQPNVLLNLPLDQVVSLVVLSLFSLSVCTSFILTLYVIFDTVWSNLLKDRKLKHPTATQYALRIILCIIPYAIAIALPDFKIMISLGAVISVLMDEIVPLILHVLMLIQKKHKSISVYLALMKDLGLIFLCTFLFGAALLNLIRNIIKYYG